MRPHIYSANREVLIEAAPRFRAYYGEEQIDELTGDYCFVVWKNGKEVFRRTNTDLLDVACGESPEAMLIAGMALYLAR